MATTTELNTGAELYHTHLVTIFLTKQGNGTEFLCLLYRIVAILLQRNILTNLSIDDVLHLTELFRCHLLKVREVKTQAISSNK